MKTAFDGKRIDIHNLSRRVVQLQLVADGVPEPVEYCLTKVLKTIQRDRAILVNDLTQVIVQCRVFDVVDESVFGDVFKPLGHPLR